MRPQQQNFLIVFLYVRVHAQKVNLIAQQHNTFRQSEVPETTINASKS